MSPRQLEYFLEIYNQKRNKKVALEYGKECKV